MPSNYEYDSLDSSAYGNDYGTPDYDVIRYVERPTGFPWIMYNIQTFVILPVVLILNLILLIKLLGNQKLRSEPWRWLVALASFCFILIIFIAYNEYANSVYQKPSLMTTPLCPVLRVISLISWNMLVVSITLLAIERFHALRLGRENEGGMGKMAVILSLILFLVFLTAIYVVITVIVPLAYGGKGFYYHKIFQGTVSCSIAHHRVGELMAGVLFVWSLVSLVVVIIGTVVYQYRKTTTDAMKQSVVAPTLAFCCFALFLMVIPDFFYILSQFFYLGSYGGILNYTIWLMNGIAFPITWLVTWSRNGDISWNRKNDAEHQRLLESS